MIKMVIAATGSRFTTPARTQARRSIAAIMLAPEEDRSERLFEVLSFLLHPNRTIDEFNKIGNKVSSSSGSVVVVDGQCLR